MTSLCPVGRRRSLAPPGMLGVQTFLRHSPGKYQEEQIVTPSPAARAPAAGRRFVILAAAVAALGGLLFGYDTGVISGALLFIQPQFGLSAGWEEIVTSAVLLGATLGALFS